MRDRTLLVIASVIAIGVFAGAWIAGPKLDAMASPGNMCVQATRSFDTHDEAMNDTLKVFPIAEDENGDFKFTSPTYDDYAFVNDTTVAYGTHDCPWWQQNYIHDSRVPIARMSWMGMAGSVTSILFCGVLFVTTLRFRRRL